MKARGPSDVRSGERQVTLRAGESRTRTRQRRLERTRIDREEKLPGFHDRSVAIMHAGHLPRDARAHFDGAARLEPSDIGVPFGYLLSKRLRDDDGWIPGRREPRSSPKV